jgi:sterol desaturase/sphingolipid hydroxylase (fatty acid hydroxylase superfamily)
MIFFIRYFFAPVFFLGFIVLAIWLTVNDLNQLWLAPLLLLAICISFLAESILPFEEIWNKPKGDVKRDVIHAIVNETSNLISVSLIPVISLATSGLNIWPVEQPLIIQLSLAIVIADFGITLAHYASHKIDILWRFHSVHHSVERLYGFNGLMKHPLHQTIELIAGTTPLLLMGLPVEIGALLAFSISIQLMLQHSNVDMRLGSLLYIWAAAPGHRHHHVASKTNGDVNFGLFTMLWDHALGTFVINRQQPLNGELGIAGRPKFPSNYIDQLVEPFRKGN